MDSGGKMVLAVNLGWQEKRRKGTKQSKKGVTGAGGRRGWGTGQEEMQYDGRGDNRDRSGYR